MPLDEIGAIDSAIVQIRAAAGYPPEIPLKWSTPGGPVTPQAHRLAKAQLLASCHQSRCELFVSICHSGVSRGASGSDGRILWGASGVLRAIHGFLEEYDSTAMVLVDRFPGVNPTPFLEEKAIRGLVYEAAGGQPARDEPLPRFSSFSASSAKASRLSSVVDVPLGAFGHCLDPKRTDAARLAAEVMPLLSRDATGSVYYRGVSVYPTRSKIQDYRAAHSRLESTLSGYGVAGVPVYED